jgi:hypothetical protein
MNARIECNSNRWYAGDSQQVPWIIDSRRTEITFDCNNLENEIWTFDNASDCPWIGIFRPEDSPSGEVGSFGYGTLWVTRNSEAPHIDEDFASSYGRIIYSPTGGGDPTQQEFQGANVFNAAIYDLNLFTPLVQENMIADMPRPGDLVLGSSLIFNNIPIFRIKPDNTIDIHDESTYKGCAYKNGHFYQEPLDLNNPYEDYESEDAGSPGTNDWESDPIPELELPSDYYGDSGLVSIWTPTTEELKALANYLWSNNGLDMDQFKKIVNNPFDLVLGLNWLPLHVSIAGQKPLNVGNILGLDSGLKMSYPTRENYRFDFGELNIGLADEMNSFVSYSPYTRMNISIPFIGKQAIDADLIRLNLPIHLYMKYNIVNGTICAYLYGKDQTLLYQWEGSVPSTIPVAQNDHTQSIAGMMGLVAGAVGGAVTGAVVGGAAGAVVGGLSGTIQGAASADLKPSITTTGSYSGNGSSLNGTGYAYIEVLQARLSVDNKHKHYIGYPRNTSDQIKNSYGYNSVKGVRVASARATDSEKEEIKQILEGGYVYGDIQYKEDGTKYGVVTPGPSVIADDSLQFMLYQNHSSNARIDKKLTHLHTYSTLTLKEPTSIQTPTIRLSATDVNMKKGNYGYIPKFDRFYYVTDVRSIPGGLWEVDLKCDVLMSFKSEIIDNYAVFNHSEWAYNLYLNDGTLQVDSRPKLKLKRFPYHLDVDGTYVLIMAGGINA